MFRFSLATFLLFVTVFALLVAGLAFPNLIWKQIICSATLLVLLAATIALVAWQGIGRWFWVGFAIAGWAYFAAAFYGNEKGRSVLLTQYVLKEADEILDVGRARAPTGERLVMRSSERGILEDNGRMSLITRSDAEDRGLLDYAYTQTTVPTSSSFQDIGHYAWTLILGCLGGIFSLWLYRTSKGKAGVERPGGRGDL